MIGLLVGGLVFTVEALWGIAIRETLYPLLTGRPFTQFLPPQRLNRASTVIAVLALPVGYGLLVGRRWVQLGVTVAAVVSTVAFSPSSTAKGCLVLGPMVTVFAWFGLRPLALGLKGGLVVLALAIPFIIAALPDSQTLWNRNPWIPNSTHHRVTIWKFTADRVMEKPLLGWGMDASRAIPGGEAELFVVPPPGLGAPHHEQYLPLHPHNAVLQWWLELGGVGVALGLTVLLTMISALSRLPLPYGGIALGLLAQGVTVAFISFGAWQAWWQAVLWLVPIPVLALMRHHRDRVVIDA